MKKIAFAYAAITLAAGMTAQAQAATLLTLPLQGTVSDSVQTFSKDAMNGFRALEITVAAKGNASAVAGTTNAFSLPVTKVVIGTKLNIASGSAVGSALYISRIDYDTEGEPEVGVTLANFTINYETSQVLADTTAKGGATSKQMPLYDFKTATPLALKYKFPLTITGNELLNDLRLTAQAKQAFISGLNLPVFAVPLLNNDFGTLTQNISTNLRKKAVSTTPYTP